MRDSLFDAILPSRGTQFKLIRNFVYIAMRVELLLTNHQTGKGRVRVRARCSSMSVCMRAVSTVM